MTYAAAINKPRLLMGFDVRVVMVSFFVTLPIAVGGDNFPVRMFAGVCFVALVVMLSRATRKDSQYLPILSRVLRQNSVYDTSKRGPFRVHISK
jgi:type IV secretory pathway TrbD component